MLSPNFLLLIFIIYTGLARIAEIWLGEKNAKAMLGKGGIEFQHKQRPAIVIIYSIWLATLLYLTPATHEPHLVFLVLFAGLQILRWLAIAHLKGFWTTRIIIMPLAWKVTTGPYRFFKHPIYVALLGEVIALSLAFHSWPTACLFGGLVMLWLFFRIRAENRALKMML